MTTICISELVAGHTDCDINRACEPIFHGPDGEPYFRYEMAEDGSVLYVHNCLHPTPYDDDWLPEEPLWHACDDLDFRWLYTPAPLLDEEEQTSSINPGREAA